MPFKQRKLQFYRFAPKSLLYSFVFATNPHLQVSVQRGHNVHFRWGWPEDVWFHVDKLSSAHVYLRLQDGQTIKEIPQELIEDCCQLVKANSIEVSWEGFRATAILLLGKQAEQRRRCLHDVEQPEEDRWHGGWASRLPSREGRQEGKASSVKHKIRDAV